MLQLVPESSADCSKEWQALQPAGYSGIIYSKLTPILLNLK